MFSSLLSRALSGARSACNRHISFDGLVFLSRGAVAVSLAPAPECKCVSVRRSQWAKWKCLQSLGPSNPELCRRGGSGLTGNLGSGAHCTQVAPGFLVLSYCVGYSPQHCAEETWSEHTPALVPKRGGKHSTSPRNVILAVDLSWVAHVTRGIPFILSLLGVFFF